MTFFLRFLIDLYQKILSPDHGLGSVFFANGVCRFYPTCSEYMKGALKRYGAVRGVARGIWRVARCNPWNRGGIDIP